MKLFNALFGGTYQFSEQLVNADKSKVSLIINLFENKTKLNLNL